MRVLDREPIEREASRGRRVQLRLPAWAKLSLVVFCAVELVLVGALRIASGLAEMHAVQEIGTDVSAATASAACTEGLAAVNDFWPAGPVLNVGRILPFATARAWGQIPQIIEVVRQACPSVQAYARVAPLPDRSLADGVAADLLTSVRRDQAQLLEANQQLGAAWTQLGGLDLTALSGDARLARVARLIDAARAQQSDISDALAVLAPQRLEELLGGSSPRSLVLSAPGGQAYMVFDQGTVVRIGLDQPDVTPVVVITVDRTGLDNLGATLTHAEIPAAAADDIIAESLLAEVVRESLSDNTRIASVVKRSAEEHHAWLWFDDPALQGLASRRGWVAQ